METKQIAKCKSPDCNYQFDQKCVEGVEIADCPHFYWAKEDLNGDSETVEAVIKNIPKRTLFSGRELDLSEISFVTNRYKSDTVILIGESECGKTTILATLFDLLQSKPFNGYHFAGSLTQLGFEERCYMARCASKGTIPETPKTTSGTFKFLHIALKVDLTEINAMHFLLSDISGETFRDATASSSLMSSLSILRHVKHLIFIIDGAKLADFRQRESAIFLSEQFIQRALDTNIFDKTTVLKIIVSKFDLLKDNKKFDFETKIIKHFNSKFANQLGKLSFLKIAVRPLQNEDDFSLGDGLKALLDEWCTPRPISLTKIELSFSNKSKRNINNFRS
jgi:hypothetical protein